MPHVEVYILVVWNKNKLQYTIHSTVSHTHDSRAVVSTKRITDSGQFRHHNSEFMNSNSKQKQTLLGMQLQSFSNGQSEKDASRCSSVFMRKSFNSLALLSPAGVETSLGVLIFKTIVCYTALCLFRNSNWKWRSSEHCMMGREFFYSIEGALYTK